VLIGLAGIPASGKSTLSVLIVKHTNNLLRKPRSGTSLDAMINTAGASAVLVGLDGWHLPRTALNAMPDPALAHAKRGAHWTFDGDAYTTFVARLREDVAHAHSTVRASWHADDVGGSGALVLAPSFDHATKDPVLDAVVVGPQHRIVLIEGLYAFLGIEPWKTAGEMLDERWFVDLSEDEARTRLVSRHVLTGVAKNLEEAYFRADDNDMPSEQLLSFRYADKADATFQTEGSSART
jgi:pantothenate kinase